ncbi:MAG: DUF1491 family protein [Parvularculaceae bacterium]|jgi:hypothetical protein|nr:DUF1491 family protein [Parvularculaceae bacterium]
MDRPPRLKSHILVAALLRRAEIAGAPAQIVRKGDADAGAVAVKVFLGRIDGAPMARLFLQGLDETGAPAWREPFPGAAPEGKIDALLDKERRFDRDLWIVEIEDRLGRNFLSD